MEGFICSRTNDPRFRSKHVDPHFDLGWERLNTTLRPTETHAMRYNASASEYKPEPMSEKRSADSDEKEKPKKRRKKKSGSGRETDTAASGSDSNGRCWKGYKPVKGKKAYTPGSCEKA